MTKKKKILLLSDDLRMASGVGTMSKEFVIGTLNQDTTGTAANATCYGNCSSLRLVSDWWSYQTS